MASLGKADGEIGFACVAVLAAAMLAACGGDDFDTEDSGTPNEPPSPCNTEPWACPPNQTCWPVGPNETYECFNEGPGAFNSPCELYAAAPTCQAGLFCGAQDVCTPFCSPSDASHACPMGLVCMRLTVQGVAGVIYTCAPP